MRLGRTVARLRFCEWGQAMDGTGEATRFSVELPLDESERRVEIDQATGQPRMVQRNRHASTRRIVERVREPVLIPEDRWTPPTVTARLRRMSAAFARLPMSADIWPGGYRSCMPEPILKRTDDYAPAPVVVRQPPRAAEIDRAMKTYQDCLRLFGGDPQRKAAFWGVALGWSWRACAQEMKFDKLCKPLSHTRMGQLMAQVTQEIADDWNRRAVSIERDDLDLARSFHRNRPGGVSNLSI